MILTLLAPAFLCAQPPDLAELGRALDARDDASVLQQLGAIRAAAPAPDEGRRIARFLLSAARREQRLSIALELAGLATALDETPEGRLFLAQLELKASEYGAAAHHLDRALALEPKSREALMARASLAREMADFAHAAALYERAAALGASEASAKARACRELQAHQRQRDLPNRRQRASARPGPAAVTTGGHASKAREKAPARRDRPAPKASAAPASAPARAQRRLALREVSDANFSRTVHGSDRPAIVLFEAPWCRPCLALNAELARLAARHAAEVDIVSLNIDGAPRTRAALSIRSIPQVLLFSGGIAPTPLPTDPAPLAAELERRFAAAER